MSELIVNKKGNKGFTIGNWNGINCLRTYSKEKGIFSYMIREVEIMSCGKKQMTARYIDNDSMAKEFLSPNTVIYVNKEDAKSKAIELFERDVKNLKEYAAFDLKSTKQGYEKYKNEPWRKGLERDTEAYELIMAEKFTMIVLEYKDFLATLDNT